MVFNAIYGIMNHMVTQSPFLTPEADLHVTFDQAVELFETLTPKRMELLRELRQRGPMSKYALSQCLARDYSNVHKDIKALLRFGLVELDPERKVRVPWDSAEIQFSLLGGKT